MSLPALIAVAVGLITPQLAWSADGQDTPYPLTDTRTGLDFVWMPGGDFLFGCDEQVQCIDGATPPQQTTLVEGFWMARGRVTYEEYAKCVTAGRCKSWPTQQQCTGTNSKVPVGCVDLANAQAFCSWIDATLPSEHQWEYAADSGYDMGANRGATPLPNHPVSTEWVLPSAPVWQTYAPTRGGEPDLTPVWPSDRPSARPDHRSAHIGFRCVKPSVEVAARASTTTTNMPVEESCMSTDTPFLGPGTQFSRLSPTLESFYTLCETETGFTARQMPLYLDSQSNGTYRYQAAAPCAYKWAFSTAIPGLGPRAAMEVYFHEETDPSVPTVNQTRSFGDTALTETPRGDFESFPETCTLQRADGVQTSTHNCRIAFAGDLNGDTHTDFVFRIHDFPGCDGTTTLVSTPTGWTSVRSAGYFSQ